jgi:hypothetical protein
MKVRRPAIINEWKAATALSGLLEGAFDQSQATLGLFAQKLLLFAAFAESGVQLVGNGESGEDRSFLGVHGRSCIGDGAHFFINVSSKFLDVSGIEIARDGVSLAEDLDSGRRWHRAAPRSAAEGKVSTKICKRRLEVPVRRERSTFKGGQGSGEEPS